MIEGLQAFIQQLPLYWSVFSPCLIVGGTAGLLGAVVYRVFGEGEF